MVHLFICLSQGGVGSIIQKSLNLKPLNELVFEMVCALLATSTCFEPLTVQDEASSSSGDRAMDVIDCYGLPLGGMKTWERSRAAVGCSAGRGDINNRRRRCDDKTSATDGLNRALRGTQRVGLN
ncbi:hypothetical protein EVAR_33915_1 [Eumeta japonica]|uniref:Uncharacterized protein n=1 Tax=Eumeta variegata TaxID=151549 RepID=A0A4C1VZX7_EUMVA|nr:hypothetical protein EVAR_33915_1 [Eumeta japonica]